MNLIQGTLDVLILKALIFGPLHGYGVVRWIRETTDGALDIEEGALYTALHRLEKRKYLASEWGVSENKRRAKYYALTETGRQHLASEIRTWDAYSAAVSKVLRRPEAST
ncbi:MAG: PadR family transcriptional regulator [Gemmatimonas sp.]|nr:PadR family transcriptional regulator [Gemmatimonas sp.]